jgi:YHS domain-containing protein
MKRETTFKNKIVKTHYVYQITNTVTGIYYIGVRTAKGRHPLEDLGTEYFTSGSLKDDFRNNTTNYIREIVQTFDNRNKADIFEQELIARHIANFLCANKRVSSRAVIELTKTRLQARTKKNRTANSSSETKNPLYSKKTKIELVAPKSIELSRKERKAIRHQNKKIQTHYVYKITNRQHGTFYVGTRTCAVANPLDDLGYAYFTSGPLQNHFSANPIDYKIDIIDTFPTREKADKFGQYVTAVNINHTKCVNSTAPSQ